jgi:diguanylate cyclase (GGDEF)-like protein
MESIKMNSALVSEVIAMMDFLSEISTLYKVEPGPEFRLITSNETAQRLGAGLPRYYGKLLRDIVPKNMYFSLSEHINQAISTLKPVRYESMPANPGVYAMMDFLVTPIIEDGECTHIWVISKHRRTEEELEYLAFNDPLTGVNNRRLLEQRLPAALKRLEQHGNCFTLMLIDCDNFKWVNDQMGHDAGDDLLRELCDRIRTCIRMGDVLARLGGDEFAILMENQDKIDAVKVSERIIAAIRKPWNIKNKEVAITVSIGVHFVRTIKSIDEVFSGADKALYQVKNAGKNMFSFFGN